MADQRRDLGRCPRPCVECDDGHHHFNDCLISTVEEEPGHPAAKAGELAWYGCKHCDAWVADLEELEVANG